MQHKSVSLIPLEASDREQFILDNQRAFWYGAMLSIPGDSEPPFR